MTICRLPVIVTLKFNFLDVSKVRQSVRYEIRGWRNMRTVKIRLVQLYASYSHFSNHLEQHFYLDSTFVSVFASFLVCFCVAFVSFVTMFFNCSLAHFSVSFWLDPFISMHEFLFFVSPSFHHNPGLLTRLVFAKILLHIVNYCDFQKFGFIKTPQFYYGKSCFHDYWIFCLTKNHFEHLFT